MAESFPTAYCHNLSALVNPQATDDRSKGYREGSVWVNTITNQVYICGDALVGAAVWNLTGGNPQGTLHGPL